MRKFLFLLTALCIGQTAVTAADFYLVGKGNDWSFKNEFKFTESNGVYILHLDKMAKADYPIGFKIAEPAWASQYGTISASGLNTKIECVEGENNNISVPDGINDGVTLKFDISDKSKPTLTMITGLYLAHDVNGDNIWWSDHPDYKFTQDNGVYTLHVNDLPSEFKVVTSDWKLQLGTSSGLVFETPMTCVEGEGNNFKRPTEYSTIAGATLTVDMRRSVPTLTVMPDLYLAGEFNSWSNTDAAYRFTRNGDVYTLLVPELSGRFRIAGGTKPEWAVQYGGPTGLQSGQTYDCIAGPGNDMTLDGGSQSNVTLTFDHSTKKLTVGTVTPPTVTGDLYLAGAVNGWASDNEAYRFTENNGIYTLTLDHLSGEFKVVTADWSQQFGCATPLVYGRTYSCVLAANGYNMMLVESVGNEVTITFDPANLSIMVSGMPSLYLVGDFNNWTASTLYAFEYGNGVYTLTTGNFSGNFKVTTVDNAVQFGRHATGAISLDKHYSIADGAAPMSFVGRPDNNSRVKITVTPDGTADSTPTGIDGVAGDNDCPVEYYNLQGIRVNRPSYGVYIRRQGNKIEKVAVQ